VILAFFLGFLLLAPKEKIHLCLKNTSKATSTKSAFELKKKAFFVFLYSFLSLLFFSFDHFS